jgi:2-keto-3-deoxy-L-rhamnonate aldolase RhmA
MIGTSDLTAEMGISGEIGHDRVKQAYKTVAEACRANGKALGMGGVYDSQMASHYINGGVRFVLSGTDHSYLLSGAKARAQVLRELL